MQHFKINSAKLFTFIYLVLTLIFLIDSKTCSGFLCGLGILIPILPTAILAETLDLQSKFEEIVFASDISYWITILAHAGLIYYILYALEKFIKAYKPNR